MKLLVDLGNTRLKCALWDGHALRYLGALPHVDAGQLPGLEELWEGIQDVSAVFIASVAQAVLEQRIVQHARQCFGVEARLLTSPAAACGVRNAYAHPERLGVDRFLGLIALHAVQPGPYVLASCGTALTLDALAFDGAHLGGLIAPSPPLMRDALTGATARLKAPRHARIVERADNTDDALESGVWLAAAALLERFLAHAQADCGARPELVLTGGGAAQLAPLIPAPHRIDPELVLRGLATYADSLGSG